MRKARPPSFKGLKPATVHASKSKKANLAKNTRQERELRKALTALGARYRLHVTDLPGKPDIVFVSAKIAVFCDGDFWHGRNWESRRRRLSNGSNAEYWIEKIRTNMRRDVKNRKALQRLGWIVLRFWEGDIRSSPERIAGRVNERVRRRSLARTD